MALFDELFIMKIATILKELANLVKNGTSNVTFFITVTDTVT